MAGPRRPEPAVLPDHPAAVVERRKTPGRGIDPGPAPRRDPGPAAVVERRPADRHLARRPELTVRRMADPVAVAVQVLPTGHASRHVAGRDRRVVQTLVPGHPIGKAVAFNRRPGIAGAAGGVEPDLHPALGGHLQRAVAALELQFTPPGGRQCGRRAAVGLPVDTVMAGRPGQPAALGGHHLDGAGLTGQQRGQAQRQRARFQPQHQTPAIQALQCQVAAGAQAQCGAAQPQLGPAVNPGAQAVAGGHRPIAQRLLRRAQPAIAVAVVPLHLARHGAQPPDLRRQLTGHHAGQGHAGHAGHAGQHQHQQRHQPAAQPPPGQTGAAPGTDWGHGPAPPTTRGRPDPTTPDGPVPPTAQRVWFVKPASQRPGAPRPAPCFQCLSRRRRRPGPVQGTAHW